ncbi:ABC transporter substrate-binding protein [Candidatus Megaera venefica]|uniref:ABC transporter substrate-binding protein n=1 Tax=Candidatus Megaera venefica TaxID=2055910 RepID=A0ABU5NAW4_9RICK|nr:ABC transporter substrate-binding protein [Candidatus Megaera venefica]MEA0970309.1 ABC transporter substrate-binding protein [Candidatus Megaera venefica]
MVKTFIWLIAIFLSSLSIADAKDTAKTVKKVYINQLVQHPALDMTTKGIIDGLAELGYINGKNLDLKIHNAQGDTILANQISARLVSLNPDVVVGNPTITAQSFVKYAKEGKVKLVFTSVTDPVGAKIVNRLDQPGDNVTGVSNFVALEPQIEMFQKIKPTMKKLGFLYNPGELNSITLLNMLKEICPRYGLEVIGITASKTSEVYQSAVKLSLLVDAIFISNDNMALSALKTIIKAANAQQIPVFVSDTDIVKDGALAALGPNQYEIGKQTARLIARILNGEDINKMNVEFPKGTELFLNQSAAAKLGIVFPKELLAKADKII